jgi:uncharacterized membrane protein
VFSVARDAGAASTLVGPDVDEADPLNVTALEVADDAEPDGPLWERDVAAPADPSDAAGPDDASDRAPRGAAPATEPATGGGVAPPSALVAGAGLGADTVVAWGGGVAGGRAVVAGGGGASAPAHTPA